MRDLYICLRFQVSEGKAKLKTVHFVFGSVSIYFSYDQEG
jgi:hypothetical protein